MKIDNDLKKSIELMAQGKQEGFTLFYNQTYSFVYKRARFIMKNDEDALDLTQETFIQAYKGITSLQDVNKVYAWLSSITYNQGMRIFDKKQEVIVTEEAEEIFDNIVSTDMDTSPEEAAQTKATSEIIKNMIEELPELQKMAILAFYYDNMKIDDIAVMFECSANTIKSRLSYAKKALQEKILAHEKANNYRLCSISPAIILMALEALFASKKYSMPAASAKALFASTQGALWATNASTATAVSATTSTGVKVGLSLTTKAAIAITTAATATVIAVAAATGGFSNAGSTPTESEISSELNSLSESEIPSGSEATTDVPLASIYDAQYTSYADSGDYLLMVTEGTIGNTGDMSDSLTTESDIYILGKDGECLSFHNTNEDGSIKYLTIAPFTGTDKALAIVKQKGNYLNLLLSDGSLFDETTKFRNFHHTNGFIVAHTDSDIGQTYNIYDSNLTLLKEGISDFGSITSCETFGEYTILRGVATDSKTFIQCIYDKSWNHVDYIEANGNTSNVTLVMDGSYLWTGDTLRDQSYNEVTIPIPDYIRPNGEQVIINNVSNGMFSSNYASVKVSVTDTTGTTTSKYYLIDTDFNTYTDETQTEDFIWVELEGTTVMYDVSDGERYVILNDTGKKLYSMLDWHDRINEVYGPSGIYGIDGNLYTDGSVLAWVAANVNSTGDIQASTFLLKESDGYSVDKSINLGVELSCIKGLYYSPDTKQIYLNHTLVNYHSILFNEEEGYYILQNEDNTFTIYRKDQTVHFTTSENLVHSFNENYFITESIVNGVICYKVLTNQEEQ